MTITLMVITLTAIQTEQGMKFYDRIKELELLQKIKEQSRNSACFTVMVGRRRIGKTSLLLESMKGKKFLYLFVSRKSEVLLCEQFQQEMKENLNPEIFSKVNNFYTLFEQLMIYASKTHFTLIIDDFQEFNNINGIGNYWDNKGENEIDLIALNRFENSALIAEVKRNPQNINIARLYETATLNKQLSHYSIEVKGLSMQNM